MNAHHAEARHDCAPRGCGGCEESASVACRFHGGLDTLVGAGSRGRARSARNRPCTSRPGTVGPRVDSPGTSMEPTCSSPRPDPAPCVTPRAPPSTRLLPGIIFFFGRSRRFSEILGCKNKWIFLGEENWEHRGEVQSLAGVKRISLVE